MKTKSRFFVHLLLEVRTITSKPMNSFRLEVFNASYYEIIQLTKYCVFGQDYLLLHFCEAMYMFSLITVIMSLLFSVTISSAPEQSKDPGQEVTFCSETK